MEKEIISALVAVSGTIIGAIIVYISTKKTTKTNFTMWYKDYSEKYQKLTFEKRLQAHQEAFYWIQKLKIVLNIFSNMEKNEENEETLWKTFQNAQEWWAKNALYLDKESRWRMIKAINKSLIYSAFKEKINKKQIWEYLDNTLKILLEGIGDEYLPSKENEFLDIKNITKNLEDLDLML